MSSRFLLNRNSNSLTAGIVGLANVGKSTFFQAITHSKLGNPANYPFATIEPSQSITKIPNEKLSHLQRLYNSERKVESTLTIYDIAGLTRGAADGKGLGNRFLNDIKLVDGILHLVRAFKGDDITHIEGSVDPVRDVSLVQDELILKDLVSIENAIEAVERKTRRVLKSSLEFKNLDFEHKLLGDIQEYLYNGQKISNFKKQWTAFEISILNKHNFLTAKPTLIIMNVDPEEYLLKNVQKIQQVEDVKKWAREFAPLDKIVPFSGELETKYNEFGGNVESFKKFCKTKLSDTAENINDVSALPEVISEMKSLLGLISYYTCGPKEVKQWNIRNGTNAQEAAGVIHTDLQKTFISASIIHYNDIKDFRPPLNESELKTKCIIKRAGKEYIMQDNDIALFTAGSGKKR